MATLTFEQINERAVAFHAREAARNAPVAVARRAVYQLVSALTDLSESEYHDVLGLLWQEIAAPCRARQRRVHPAARGERG